MNPLDHLSKLLNQSTQDIPKSEPVKKEGCFKRLQNYILTTLAILAVFSLAALCGAIVGFSLVPPKVTVNDRICPTTAPLECEHGSIPSIPKLRMEITSQSSERVSGAFYNGKKLVCRFDVTNDHENRQSTMNITNPDNPYEREGPASIRYEIAVIEEILPRVEQFIRYEIN